MRYFQIPFDDVKIDLNTESTADQIRRYSPSGRIPCLLVNGQAIWDSLAICEYLAELLPQKRLWPQDAAARAQARSICAEMHSSFTAMRKLCFQNLCARTPEAGMRAMENAEVGRDVERVHQIWSTCLSQHQKKFLFGDFSIADAYFAPMVLRFRTYELPVKSGRVRDYLDTIERLEPVQQWISEAVEESPAEQ